MQSTHHGERIFVFSEFNWLDFQFLIRTPTKHVIFNHNLQGHPGAVNQYVNPLTALAGGKSEGSPQLHKYIDDLFLKSCTINQYISGVVQYYETFLMHQATPYIPENVGNNYLIDGTSTANRLGVRFFAQHKSNSSYCNMYYWLREFLTHIQLTEVKHKEVITYAYQPEYIMPVQTGVCGPALVR